MGSCDRNESVGRLAVLPSRQSHNIMQTGPSIHRPPSDRDPLDAAAWCQWAVRKFVVAVLLHPSTLLIAAILHSSIGR